MKVEHFGRPNTAAKEVNLVKIKTAHLALHYFLFYYTILISYDLVS